MLIFTHIPKTGGTTVITNFLTGTRAVHQIHIPGNYKEEEVHSFLTGARRSPNSDWPPVSFEVPCSDIVKLISFLHSPGISKIKLIQGHLPYGVHHYIDGPSYYFTVIREPVARVWSLYTNVMRSKNHYLYDIWRDQYDWNLMEILKDHPPEICNDQFRMLLGTSYVHFTNFDLKKIPDIINNYSYITTTDKIAQIGSKFGYLFKWHNLKLQRSFNVSQYKESVVKSTKLTQMIIDYNRYDIALYNYVVEKGIVFNMRRGEPFNV